MIHLKHLFIIFFLTYSATFAQINSIKDTIAITRSNTFFKFEKLNNNHTKNIRSGRFVSIDLYFGDTTHLMAGTLFDADSNVIKIIPEWEYKAYQTTDFRASTTIDFENSLTSISISNIKSLQFSREIEVVPFTFGGLGILTALVVVPLVSIDKNSPSSFNSKRYTSIVIQSLVVSGIGVTVGYIIQGGAEKYKFKPTLIKSYKKYIRRSKRFMARQGMTW